LPLWPGDERLTRVRDLPLSHLDPALRSWVNEWRKEDKHPLMVNYAIDAVQFVVAHAYGVDKFEFAEPKSRWQIPALLPVSLVNDDNRQHCLLNDPTFKRQVTAQIEGILVLAKVPTGGQCLDSNSRDVVLDAGAEFIAQIGRCHLSESRNDWETWKAIDDAEPALYLARQFRLYCEILARLEREASSASPCRVLDLPPTRWRRAMYVPVRWITHALREHGESSRLEAVPVPDWLSG